VTSKEDIFKERAAHGLWRLAGSTAIRARWPTNPEN